MEVLQLEYRRTIRNLKKAKETFDRQEKDLRLNGYIPEADQTAQEIKLVNEMISNKEEELEWITTGRDPRAYRGADKQYPSTWTPELINTCSVGLYDDYNEMDKRKLTTEEQEKLEDALCQLTKNEKNVFMLHVIEGYSFQDIADLIGVKKPSVQSYYDRAIKKVERRKNESLFLVV